MYTTINFKTKKALKEAVKAHNDYRALKQPGPMTVGAVMASKVQEPKPVTIFQPGPFGRNEPKDGTFFLEGPHYPAAHTWYAKAEMKDGFIVSVK